MQEHVGNCASRNETGGVAGRRAKREGGEGRPFGEFGDEVVMAAGPGKGTCGHRVLNQWNGSEVRPGDVGDDGEVRQRSTGAAERFREGHAGSAHRGEGRPEGRIKAGALGGGPHRGGGALVGEEIEEGVADGDLVLGVAGAHEANHRRFGEAGRNSEQTN